MAEPTRTEAPLDPTVGRTRLARVYAEALMGAAAEANQIDAVGDELDALVGSLADAPNLEAYLVSPAVSRKLKTAALTGAMAERASPLVRNFVGVLDKNGRLGTLRGVAAAYRRMRDQKSGRVRVSVTSAVPLTASQTENLTRTLAARLNQTPVLSTTVNPELLGGLVVRVGDQVFDTSVRTRLQTLRTQLMGQGTSYVLQNQG